MAGFEKNYVVRDLDGTSVINKEVLPVLSESSRINLLLFFDLDENFRSVR